MELVLSTAVNLLLWLQVSHVNREMTWWRIPASANHSAGFVQSVVSLLCCRMYPFSSSSPLFTSFSSLLPPQYPSSSLLLLLFSFTFSICGSSSSNKPLNAFPSSFAWTPVYAHVSLFLLLHCLCWSIAVLLGVLPPPAVQQCEARTVYPVPALYKQKKDLIIHPPTSSQCHNSSS